MFHPKSFSCPLFSPTPPKKLGEDLQVGYFHTEILHKIRCQPLQHNIPQRIGVHHINDEAPFLQERHMTCKFVPTDRELPNPFPQILNWWRWNVAKSSPQIIACQLFPFLNITCQFSIFRVLPERVHSPRTRLSLASFLAQPVMRSRQSRALSHIHVCVGLVP